jgi:hypothetical protein
VDRNQWHQYLLAAKEYNQGAMNNYDNELWTSASILFVHAAIAYTDALTIKAGSVKNQLNLLKRYIKSPQDFQILKNMDLQIKCEDVLSPYHQIFTQLNRSNELLLHLCTTK